MPSEAGDVDRWPALRHQPEALAWLRLQVDLGLARRTIDAYGRALDEYVSTCTAAGIEPTNATRADVARYVRDLAARPHPRGANVLAVDSGGGLANATLQQRLVAVRLFHDYLVEGASGRTTLSDAAGIRRGRASQATASVA